MTVITCEPKVAKTSWIVDQNTENQVEVCVEEIRRVLRALTSAEWMGYIPQDLLCHFGGSETDIAAIA
jgi:hypothetical protein